MSALLLVDNMLVEPQPYDLIIDSKNQHHESKLLFCLQLKVCVLSYNFRRTYIVLYFIFLTNVFVLSSF